MTVRAALAFAILIMLLQGCAGDQLNVQSLHSRFLRPPKSTDGVIIFVHGLFGNSESTWRNKNTGAFWPDLVSNDPAFTGNDIFLVDYESPYIKTASNIEEIAQRVLQQITDSRVLEYKKIYLITHSMGGLIAKRIITTLNRPSTVDQLRRIRAILYLSTPAQGAPLADIASWISMNPQLKDLSPSDFSTFLQSLENDWQQLLRERDRSHENYPLSFCAYETQPTGLFHVVTRLYSTTRCDNTPYAIDLDHIGIVKPSDINTDPYPWVRARIEEANHLHEASRIEPKTPSGTARLPVPIAKFPFEIQIARAKSRIRYLSKDYLHTDKLSLVEVAGPYGDNILDSPSLYDWRKVLEELEKQGSIEILERPKGNIIFRVIEKYP